MVRYNSHIGNLVQVDMRTENKGYIAAFMTGSAICKGRKFLTKI
jgi:hypothetical protein